MAIIFVTVYKDDNDVIFCIPGTECFQLSGQFAEQVLFSTEWMEANSTFGASKNSLNKNLKGCFCRLFFKEEI